MSHKPEYIFSIDTLSPESLSMKNLSKYLADLSDLIGDDSAVHFDRVQSGSAELVWWPEPFVEHEVVERLKKIPNFLKHREIHDPVLKLNKRLANDNASAHILTPNRTKLVSFPGKNFKSFKTVPAFSQEDTLQGTLVRIGGKDDSIHAQLDMGGKRLTSIEMSKELAREVVQHFLGPTIKLNGKARWSRDYLGDWKLINFKVHSFELLEDSSLESAIEKMGSYLKEGIGASENLYQPNTSNEEE